MKEATILYNKKFQSLKKEISEQIKGGRTSHANGSAESIL
jgi:hypothetical protein